MASYRDENPEQSPTTLKHFRKKDSDNTLVTCKHCSEIVVFRNSLRNLKKHLKLKHSGPQEANEKNSDDDHANSLQKLKFLSSKIWDYFNIHDEIAKMAECTQCSQLLPYKNTFANLTEHLRRIHAVEFVKMVPQEDEVEEAADIDPEDMPVEKLDSEDENVDDGMQLIDSVRCRGKSSMAWQHFTVHDEERKLATCKLCGAVCSYRASVSNLMKHARRKHGAANLAYEGNHSLSTVSRGCAVIWLYFKMLDRISKLCQCLICHKLFRYSANNDSLRKHLARKHQNVKIPDDDDGIEDTGTTTTSIDEFGSEISRKRSKQNNVDNNNVTSSDEEEITLLEKSRLKRNFGSIDYFGRYIASLLKQLPTDVANNLQVDFIKQIMLTQKAVHEQEIQNDEVDKSDGYLLTSNVIDADAEVDDAVETNYVDPIKEE